MQHITGHFKDAFTGQMTKPTVSKHWRKPHSGRDQARIWPEPLHHV